VSGKKTKRRFLRRLQKSKKRKIPTPKRGYNPNLSITRKTEVVVGDERRIQIRFSTQNSSNEYVEYDEAVQIIIRLFNATEKKIREATPKPPFYRLMFGIEGEGFRYSGSGTIQDHFYIWREAIIRVPDNDLWQGISDGAPFIMKDFSADDFADGKKRKSDDADFYLIRRCRIYVEKRLPTSTKKGSAKAGAKRRRRRS
jgi:hypothetical protein